MHSSNTAGKHSHQTGLFNSKSNTHFDQDFTGKPINTQSSNKQLQGGDSKIEMEIEMEGRHTAEQDRAVYN